MGPHNKRVFQRSMKKTAQELASNNKTVLQQSKENFAEEKTFQYNNELWQLEEGSSQAMASQCNNEVSKFEEGSAEEVDSEYNKVLRYFEDGSAEEMDSQCKKLFRYFDEGSADEMASQYNKLLRHSKEPKYVEFKKQDASNHESGNAETSASETISSFMDEIPSSDRPPAQLLHSSRPRKAAWREDSQLQYPGSKRLSGNYSTAMQRYLAEPFEDGGTVFFRQAMLDQSYGNQTD